MASQSTERQGQYLAFVYSYTVLFGHPPSEADRQRFFGTPPATIHVKIFPERTAASNALCEDGKKHRVVAVGQRVWSPWKPVARLSTQSTRVQRVSRGIPP
jgi:repressor LexA